MCLLGPLMGRKLDNLLQLSSTQGCCIAKVILTVMEIVNSAKISLPRLSQQCPLRGSDRQKSEV